MGLRPLLVVERAVGQGDYNAESTGGPGVG